MYIRLNKYESKRIYEMILDEAARQRLFFFSSSRFKMKPQVKKNVKEKENQSKEFLPIPYTYIQTMTSQV